MTADTVGGVWTYALDLCRSYAGKGVEVCLATMGGPLTSSQQADAAIIPGLQVCASNYKLEWMDEPWADVAEAGGWLLSLEKAFQPDVIHLNGYVHASLDWEAPVLVAAHSCVLSWWRAVKNEPAPAGWDLYRDSVKRGLEAADMVVTISNSYAEELSTVYGPVDNMMVVYNGRNAHDFYSAEKKMQAFAMGRIWDEAKNLGVLGKIANKHQLPILVAGDKHHPGTGLSVELANVQLAGVLGQVAVREQLAASYMYIAPAKYEPFGLSVLEAALSGCLLLLADIPTLRELWQDTALYFDPEKPEELDRVLDYAFTHQQECKALVERSMARAKLFSLDRMADQYMQLYASLRTAKNQLIRTIK